MGAFLGLSNRSRGQQCSPVPHRYTGAPWAFGPTLGGAPCPPLRGSSVRLAVPGRDPNTTTTGPMPG